MTTNRDRDDLYRATADLPQLTRAEARQHARGHLRTTRPLLTATAPPPVETEPASDEENCEVCGEPDGDLDDVVANFWDGQRTRLAHVDCAPDGWTLA